MITNRHVHVKKVWGIPQFWLLWMVLCMNVSAGIGVIGMSSPMLQEVFGGHLIGLDLHFADLDKTQLAAIAGVAAGFTALLSLFNIGGRFVWASFSDKLGRKTTYFVFFVLGGALYASIPSSAAAGNQILFVSAFCIILSMYGGGFATIPAYLADLFGTQMVGAIHGRLLTAWATAGILGPVVVNYMRDYQLSLGLPREQVYNQTMYILVGMLVIGFICNWLVKPIDAKYFMTDEELSLEKKLAHEKASSNEVQGSGAQGMANNVLTAPIEKRLRPHAVCLPGGFFPGRPRRVSVVPYFPIGYMSWMNQSAEYRHEWQIGEGRIFEYGVSWSRPVYDGQRERHVGLDVGLRWGE